MHIPIFLIEPTSTFALQNFQRICMKYLDLVFCNVLVELKEEEWRASLCQMSL
jgi:hypothetical protein